MLRIVDIHTASSARGEYIVLQNQGLVTVSLRGWALCTDAYLQGNPVRLADEMYVFRDDIAVKPYTRVVLFTGEGRDGWQPTVDGRQAYCAYWGRTERVWSLAGSVHVLQLFASRRIAPPVPTAVGVAA
jgi:hypothetical protein